MTKTMERAALPMLLVLLAAWAFWSVFGPGITQYAVNTLANIVAADVAQPAAQAQTWTDPNSLPATQPAEGAIVLEGFGTLSWNCQSGEFFYTFTSFDPQMSPWTYRDSQMGRGEGCKKTNWGSLEWVLEKLKNSLFKGDSKFFWLEDAWYMKL